MIFFIWALSMNYMYIITMGFYQNFKISQYHICLYVPLVIMFYINLVGTRVILSYPFWLSHERICENAPHVTRLIYTT